MRIAIFGAGAIGGFLAVKLMEAGADVTVIARGANLAAIRAGGITLRSEGKTTRVTPRAAKDAAEAGPQDYVFITLKANALPDAAEQIVPLLGPETALVTGMNGVPWWYFYGIDSPFRNRPIESVDPGGLLWKSLPPSRVIGGVVYPSAEVVEPGVIEHIYGNRFTLGEPNGAKSERGERLSKLMTEAGLKSPLRPRIRDELWMKLWGNLSFNPLSALTGATLDVLASQPDLRDVARTMMLEAQAMAEKLGVKFALDVEKRMDGALEVGAHKTSMLQDLERGKPMEIDALLGAVVELGTLTGDAMPMCKAILALVRERARKVGGYA